MEIGFLRMVQLEQKLKVESAISYAIQPNSFFVKRKMHMAACALLLQKMKALTPSGKRFHSIIH